MVDKEYAKNFYKNRRNYFKDRRIEVDGYFISPDAPLTMHGTSTGFKYYCCGCPTCLDWQKPTRNQRDAKDLIIQANIMNNPSPLFNAMDHILLELRNGKNTVQDS